MIRILDDSLATAPVPNPRTNVLTARRRMILHRLLNGEQRRCSVAALEALRRCGWIHGPELAYQFTDTGRQIAEFSEEAGPLDRNLPIDPLLLATPK
ncbi:MAG TPA: hypothetical protein VLI90_00295 [Tepidisphaeraceae bacterium]|nr:hypothetical protein [Tepidisphaeraceae bacterium]